MGAARWGAGEWGGRVAVVAEMRAAAEHHFDAEFVSCFLCSSSFCCLPACASASSTPRSIEETDSEGKAHVVDHVVIFARKDIEVRGGGGCGGPDGRRGGPDPW